MKRYFPELKRGMRVKTMSGEICIVGSISRGRVEIIYSDGRRAWKPMNLLRPQKPMNEGLFEDGAY